jgi:hypothetical protein
MAATSRPTKSFNNENFPTNRDCSNSFKRLVPYTRSWIRKNTAEVEDADLNHSVPLALALGNELKQGREARIDRTTRDTKDTKSL